MKYFVQPFDARGNIDPSIEHGLLDYLPGRVDTEAQADCVIVPVAYLANYQFSDNLRGLHSKLIVILDFLEMGWEAGDKQNLLGTGALSQFGHLSSEEWQKLDQQIVNLQATEKVLTFKRELFERDRSERMLPIEWPCRIPAPPLQSKEEFDARNIKVINNWGLSSPIRPHLHGQIFSEAHGYGIDFVDSWEQKTDGIRVWITVHTPHYLRRPLEEIIAVQCRSKISVSLPGAGQKCFRSSEAAIGSVMALMTDKLAWSFPWRDRENCIRLREDEEMYGTLVSQLDCAVGLENLYDLYVESQLTIEKYRSLTYAIEYILPAITNIL